MNLYSVAIGEQYEKESNRLKKSMIPLNVDVFTNKDVERQSDDNLLNGLYHKSNFANYIERDIQGSVIFMDADMFTLTENPFESFKVENNTDLAYVPYSGKWHLPDKIRQESFDYHGHKINSGFLYFKNLEVAIRICSQWRYEYLERGKLYDVEKGISKHEYDEWALMIALQKIPDLKVELLDKKWNHWQLDREEDIRNSKSIFFQSHKNLNILNNE